LETDSGRVWRFDDVKGQFVIVTREISPVEKSWLTLLTSKATADAVNALTEVTKSSSHAEHQRLAGLIDGHIKAMDAHLAQISR
jgi:hypothetical protein